MTSRGLTTRRKRYREQTLDRQQQQFPVAVIGNRFRVSYGGFSYGWASSLGICSTDTDMCSLRRHCHMNSRGLTTRQKRHREQTL